MPDRDGFLPERIYRDDTFLGILLSNAFTLVMALTRHWSAAPVLWTYWGQSVVIGALNVIRMLCLREFSTDGFRTGGVQPPPNRETKIKTASFFAFHYGFFHFIYAVFLSAGSAGGRIQPGDVSSVWTAVGIFAVAHSYSLIRNHGDDFRNRKPNIGTLMFYPYLRILPMHLTIILGSMFPQGALPLFVVLKSAADGGMHLVERALFRSADESVSDAAPAAGGEDLESRKAS